MIKNRLTYEEFIEVLKEKGMPNVKDSPLLRSLFRSLCEAELIILKGDLPELEGPTPFPFPTERLDKLEARLEILEDKSIP